MSRKRIPLNQNGCTANFRIGVPFGQNLQKDTEACRREHFRSGKGAVPGRIYTALKEKSEKMLKKPNYLTVPAALKELEKIVMIRQLDGVYRLDHAVTATQKTILDAFGLNEGNVRYQAKEIGNILQNQ